MGGARLLMQGDLDDGWAIKLLQISIASLATIQYDITGIALELGD